MKCTYCGSELKEHTLYCEKCGKEVRMVPDYNMYDDDYLNKVLLNQEQASEDEEESTVENAAKLKKEEKLRKLRQQREMERKKKMKRAKILLAIAAVVILVLVVAVVKIVSNITNERKNGSSYEYQYQVAEKALKANKISEAIKHFEKAASIDKSDLNSRYILLDLYLDKKDYNNAIVICSEILKVNETELKAYEALITAYEGKGDYDSIEKLSTKVPEVQEIVALFDDYLVISPTTSVTPGTYETGFDVELSAGSATIYYTLDGEDPRGSKAVEYTGPISLTDAKRYKIRAVAKNNKDVFSDVVSFVYVIDLAAPTSPRYYENATTVAGAFYTVAGKTSDDPPTIKINVPENCKAYYRWNNPTPSITSTLYDDSVGIEMKEGNNAFYVIYIDDRNDKCSSIGSKTFEYYPN